MGAPPARGGIYRAHCRALLLGRDRWACASWCSLDRVRDGVLPVITAASAGFSAKASLWRILPPLRHWPPRRRWVTSLGPCSMSSSSLSLVTVVPQIQFNDRVVDFPVVCCDRYSSLVCVQRPCSAWLVSGYMYCVSPGACYGRNFALFLREGCTLILKSILHPALRVPTGEVCTVDALFFSSLHLEICIISTNPLYFAVLFSAA